MYLLKRDNFWSLKETTSLGSWMWRKLIKFRALAKSFCKVEIQNGQNTSFWFDDWSRMGRMMDVLGNRGCVDMGISRHMSVAEAWDRRRRRRHRTGVLNLMEEALDSTRQTRNSAQDVVLWRGKDDVYKPSFSTKDTWNHIRTTATTVTWHNGVWFPHATPKFSFCVWLAVHNRLSTGDRMLQWNNGALGTCVLCNNAIESRDHLFFSCVFCSEVWSAVAKNIFKANYSTDWHTILNLICGKWQNRTESFTARYAFQTVVSVIWRERNKRRHGESPNSASRLTNWIDKQIRNRFSAIRLIGDRRYDKGLQAWFDTRN
ncbi:Reverse transcriptase zinc-binding domain [Arabidopsis suecica]|uniref:Reverse transcriptase zinc-binding domain n=1 Tax=Arabidopsis suecica TaxID=45249 RepID=A0A8T2AH62_ARASU|nr:Reverse transcriptase zinc-binding domain [Arabidopsis suecica]